MLGVLFSVAFLLSIEFTAFNKKNKTPAISMNFNKAAKKLPYLMPFQLKLAISCTLAALSAGVSKMGVIMSSTNDETIELKAAPIITATASSMMLPRKINCLNSLKIFINVDFVFNKNRLFK